MKTKIKFLFICLLAAGCNSGVSVSDAASEFERTEEEITQILKDAGHEISGSTMDAKLYEALAFEVLMDNIEKAEETLYGKNNEFRFDETKAQQCVEAYLAYCERFSQKEDAPDYMFKAADLLRALRKPGEALVYYERICTDFPDYPKVPHSVFLQGFVYENDMQDMEKARAKYEDFLNKYPDHDLADDVEFSLKYLGKSPEDIIKQFEDARPSEEVSEEAGGDEAS